MNEQTARDLAERWFRQHYRFEGAIAGVASSAGLRGWYVELRCEQLNQIVAVTVDDLGQIQPLGEGLPFVLRHDSTGESRELEALH
jgi:hypothetical protein